MSDLEFKHEQEIKTLNRQVARLKSDLEELNKYVAESTEKQEDTLGTLACVMRATNISTIASLRAVQQDMTSRMSILLDMIRHTIPDHRLNAMLHEAQERISALPPTNVLQERFAAELERQQEAMEAEATRIINESGRNSK